MSEEMARALATARRDGRSVTLDPAALEVVAVAFRRAPLTRADATRHRLTWGIPTISPSAELARLQLIRCVECGRYWRPDNLRTCSWCPRISQGATPRDRAEAEAFLPHAVTLTA